MMRIKNIQTSGGIFSNHFIESILQDHVGHPALNAETFTFPNYERLSESELDKTISDAWENLVARWDTVEREFGALDISSLRKRWLNPLLNALGFNLEFNRGDLVIDEDHRFPISHIGWVGTSHINIPIHTLLYQSEDTLETKARPGRGIKALAPHDMLQRYLNLSDAHKWGLVTDGVYLRLLRDYYHTYTRGYTEFDLQNIFSTRDYASFRALYRLCHASRFLISRDKEQAPIDELYEDALAMGVAVGKDLRENVQKAIEALGNGFLVSTPGFLDSLQGVSEGAQTLYHEILVTIYRILFLLFAEQRGMLPGRSTLYMEEFSLTSYRTLAERPIADDPNLDLWEKLKTTFAMIEHGVEELDVFPYNGALFSQKRTPTLTPGPDQDSPKCRNDAFLQAVRHLTTIEKDHVNHRISYSDLSVEEIGSIYESLLDITPRITPQAIAVNDREIPPNTFFLDLRGLGRKTTGSYYTPPSLVNELIKSALEPVMLDRLKNAVPGYDSEMVEALMDQEREIAEASLLKIKVVDPACGSGAFLIAANNKLGLELARIRSGSIFPSEDAIRHARRDVLAHCIHGVDLNPMAVELCKVSLWINAAVEDAPLNFLDHHIQCGNSLVGATPELVKAGIPNEAYDAVTGDDKDFATSLKRQNRQELDGQGSLNFKVTLIKDKRALTKWLQASRLAESQPAVADEAFQAYQTSQQNWEERLPFDLWTAAFFTPIQPGQPIPTTHHVRQALKDPGQVQDELQTLAKQTAKKYRFFHWHLAFPEVFTSNNEGGFDVVIGNPPWEVVQNSNDNNEDNPSFEKLKNWFKSTKFQIIDGRRDLYKLFIVESNELIKRLGRTSFVIPFGIMIEKYSTKIRRKLFSSGSVIKVQHFQNAQRAFFSDVHASYRFVLLTYTRENGLSHSYSTYIKGPGDIGNEDWITMKSNNLEEELGESYEAILFPTKAYHLLHEKILEKLKDYRPLNYQIKAEFHASTDRNKGKLNKEPKNISEWRILKNRSIHQYDHTYGEADLFISETDVKKRLIQKDLDPHIWGNLGRLIFRDIARNDDTRTLISCITPTGYVSSYDTPMIVPTSEQDIYNTLLFTCGILNSFIFDFLIRPYVDKHIKGYIIKRLPIPAYDSNNQHMQRILHHSTLLTKLIPSFQNRSPNQKKELNSSRAIIDIEIAKMAGISKREMILILSTFSDHSEEDYHFGLSSKKLILDNY